MDRNVSNECNYNKFYVSSIAETAYNVPQTLDMALQLALGDIFSFDAKKETNEKMATGFSGPTEVYDLGRTGLIPLSFDMMKCHELLFAMAYILGDCSVAPAGIGYEHTMKEMRTHYQQGVRKLPTFTGMQAVGNVVDAKRIVSLGIKSGTFSLQRGNFPTLKGDCVSSGKVDKAYDEVSVAGLDNATTITLPTAVEGTTDQERRNSVHYVRVLYNGGDREPNIVSVSSANPAVVTIASLGGTGDPVTYKVCYAATYPTWASTSVPLLIEPPCRVTDACVTVNAQYDGTDVVGGRPLGSFLDGIELKFDVGLEPALTPCSTGDYAGECLGKPLDIGIKLTSKAYDRLLQELEENNEKFCIDVTCISREAFDTGQYYMVRFIIPYCSIMSAKLVEKNRMLYHDCQIIALDGQYGKIIVKGKNLWPHFIQA